MLQKRVFIYVRVSTNELDIDGFSISQQIEHLKKYCELKGWNLVNIYTDEGYSGRESSRPALDQMIEDIKKGHTDIVLVDRLDRFSHYMKDVRFILQEVFEPNNVAVVSPLDHVDTTTLIGKAWLNSMVL